MIDIIQSPQNPHIKEARKLAENRRERLKTGLTLLDGPHLLAAWLDAGRSIERLLLTQEGLANPEIAALAERTDAPKNLLDDRLFAELSELPSQSGVLAIVGIPPARPPRRDGFCLLLDGVQDPGNVGAILRTAVAAGVEQALLSPGCADVWSPKTLRAGMGAQAVLDIVERADLPVPSPPKGGSVGIDLGVKELATLSDGTIIHNPHALKSNLGRLKKAQRNLSRKRKGSNRRREARTRVARLHARVADLRRDLLDKTTTMLARTYADISIEDLNVAGMVRNHRLARSVEDAAFAEFRRQLEYKTARTGARLHVIDRWHPSSKTCSNCGTVKAKLSLSERVYHCEECGLVIDRDLNAAINIQVAGSAPETLNARGGSGRRTDASRRATRHPVKREPSDGVSRVSLGAGLGNEAMQMTSL